MYTCSIPMEFHRSSSPRGDPEAWSSGPRAQPELSSGPAQSPDPTDPELRERFEKSARELVANTEGGGVKSRKSKLAKISSLPIGRPEK